MLDTMPIPNVHQNAEALSYAEAQSICEDRVYNDELPCSVVTIDSKVCYAFMLMDGTVVGDIECFRNADMLANESKFDT